MRGNIKTLGILMVFCLAACLVSQPLAAQTEQTQSEYEKRAEQLWNDNSLEELRSVLDAGLKKYPASAELWDLEAAYYFAKGDFPQCLKAGQKALSLDPTATRYQNMGWFYYSSRAFKEALPFFEKAEEIGKEKVHRQFYYVGDCYEMLGNKTKATEYYNKYLAYSPSGKLANSAREALKRIQTGDSDSDDLNEFFGEETEDDTGNELVDDLDDSTGNELVGDEELEKRDFFKDMDDLDPDKIDIKKLLDFDDSVPDPVDSIQPDCCYHIFSAGCNIGWAGPLFKVGEKRTRMMPADEGTCEILLKAGEHIQAAYSNCSKMNPAWQDWKDKKNFIQRQVDMLRAKPIPRIRRQVYQAVTGLHHWSKQLKSQVAHQYRNESIGNKATCAEKYFLMGLYLSKAQVWFKIAQGSRDKNKPDWKGYIVDGQKNLNKALDVLEKYYLVQTGICVDIVDLKPKQRILEVGDIRRITLELDQRIAKLDKLVKELRMRIKSHCTDGHDSDHLEEEPQPEPLDERGRLIFQIAAISTESVTFGTDVSVKLRITLRKDGGPVSFEMPRRYQYTKWIRTLMKQNGEKLSLEFAGKTRELVEVDLGRMYYVSEKNGRTTKNTRWTLNPGESLILLDMCEMRVHGTDKWDQAHAFKFEYMDNGKKVSQLTPVFSPRIYWKSYRDMDRGVKPRIPGR